MVRTSPTARRVRREEGPPMAVVKKLTRLGDSRAVVLPKPFLDQLALGEFGEVELTLEKDRIIVAPHRYATETEARGAAKRMIAKHGKALARLAK
jgi:antitoxin component of MazEF toxin-antitoxin module